LIDRISKLKNVAPAVKDGGSKETTKEKDPNNLKEWHLLMTWEEDADLN